MHIMCNWNLFNNSKHTRVITMYLVDVFQTTVFFLAGNE